jgi:hypothetical protein
MLISLRKSRLPASLANAQAPSLSRARLQSRWREWTAIVELFAKKSPARKRVGAREYAELHSQVIAACRLLAHEAPDDAARAYFTELEHIAEPWLSPRALSLAGGEILKSLLARCRAVEHELGVRRMLAPPPAARLLGVSLFTLLVVLGCALAWAAGPAQALKQARGWADDAWLIVRRASDLQKLAALVFVVIPVSIYAIARTARN